MKAPSRAKLVALWVCAGLAILLLIASYVVALLRDTLPRGHPWHGVALAALAAFFLLQTVLHRGGTALRVTALLLPLCAMGAMVAALATTGGGR